MKEPITLESLAAELARTNQQLVSERQHTKRELRRARVLAAASAFIGLVGIAAMTAPQAFAQGPGPTTATLNAALIALTGRVSTAESTLTSVQSSVATANANITSIKNAQTAQAATLSTLSSQGTTSNGRIDALESKTQFMLVSGTNTIFRGTNLYVQSGLGSTTGELVNQDGVPTRPEMTNGLGNLIIGYNENHSGFDRSGSHNLVLGVESRYSSFSGIVAGAYNSITGRFASAIGGQNGSASGSQALVLGGCFNTASGLQSVTVGGYYNTASGNWALGTGGFFNSASGDYSTVTGTSNSEDRISGWRASETLKN